MMIIILITMFFNGGMIPFFMVVNQLGMVDALGSDYSHLLQYEHRHAQNGDSGDSRRDFERRNWAGPLRILFHIVVPLTTSFIVVIILFNGVAQWNSWANANVYLYFPSGSISLQLVLRDLLMSSVSDMGLKFPPVRGRRKPVSVWPASLSPAPNYHLSFLAKTF
ncbi:MAG: hypothetical protein ACLRSW_03670 [Christensenellaceae bacterium]